VGVEVKSHTFIRFGRVGLTHSVFVIFGDGLIGFEGLSVYTPVDVERMKGTLKEKFTHVQQYEYR
jgi:hypothetical protein